MAVNVRAVSVADTATAIDTSSESDDRSGSSIAIFNNGSATVYLGDSDVTTATGYPLGEGEHFACDLGATTERIYGIVASGTVEVRVLEVGI